MTGYNQSGYYNKTGFLEICYSYIFLYFANHENFLNFVNLVILIFKSIYFYWIIFASFFINAFDIHEKSGFILKIFLFN